MTYRESAALAAENAHPRGIIGTDMPTKATPFDAVGEVHKRVRALHDRITDLEVRLCGPDAVKATGGNPASIPAGAIPIMQETCESALAAIRACQVSLDRIEGMVP